MLSVLGHVWPIIETEMRNHRKSKVSVVESQEGEMFRLRNDKKLLRSCYNTLRIVLDQLHLLAEYLRIHQVETVGVYLIL